MEDKEIKPDRYSIESKFPKKRVLSLVLLIAIAVLYGLFPIVGKNIESLNPGPLTPEHALLQSNCRACHETPFIPVRDQACLSCHKLSEHTKIHNEHYKGAEGTCISCHAEHHGKDGLHPDESKLCTSCHSNIQSVAPDSKMKSFVNWMMHPDRSYVDPSHIKLNHAVHLKEGIEGDSGKENLTCESCHHLSPDRKQILAISYKNDCQRCHTLGFDEKIVTQAPHADPDVVYAFIYGEYAKRALAMREGAQLRERQVPGKMDIPSMDARTRSEVVASARRSEEFVFSKTGCFLCHELSKREGVAPDSMESAYTVAKSDIPLTWNKNTFFNHGAHDAVTCESCHTKSRESKLTGDVLLPKVAECQKCHMNTEGHGADASCITCHSFHDSVPLSAEAKKNLDQFLKTRL